MIKKQKKKRTTKEQTTADLTVLQQIIGKSQWKCENNIDLLLYM